MKEGAPKNMRPDRELLNRLKDADATGQTAYTRHLCEAVLDKWPDHGPTLIRYACSLIELAVYDLATSVLDHAAAVVPEERMHLVHAQRGHLLEHMGDFIAAEEQHLKAHSLDPDDATYLIYAGGVAFRRGDIQQAEQYARHALECTDGSLEEAHFNLGGCLLSQKRYPEARYFYLNAFKIDP
ncbi:MAG: tetratricopeptide repeat protein [Verrucomicrobiota bacterium]